MSFDINKKPKLVESKIYKYYDNKVKIKENNKIIPIIEYDPWYKKPYDCVCIFIKQNYKIFFIGFLISVLLYVRYIEVRLRKKKMKDTIDKINKEKEINQFIELQEINKKLNELDYS